MSKATDFASPITRRPMARPRAMALGLVVSASALAGPVAKNLAQLTAEARQDLYNYSVMAALAYRADGTVTGQWPPIRQMPAALASEGEQAFLRQNGYSYLGAKEANGIRVIAFYNPDLHKLVLATRGTMLNERYAMILNLISDLGIGRHLTDEEILKTLKDTIQRQRGFGRVQSSQGFIGAGGGLQPIPEGLPCHGP